MLKGSKPRQSVLLMALAALAATGCTGQLPGSFRLQQQEEVFSSQLQINTKIDLLWVVDNSSSMDVSQERLRNGFANFAHTYMKPTWDIRVAVITTDAYLANPAFANHLAQTIPNTVGYDSAYMRTKTIVNNPIWDSGTGTFSSGIKWGDLSPVWGANYAKLIPGMHDGPIPALCFEGLPYFLKSVSNCAVRDNPGNTGVANCLTPAGGEQSVSQCVNTVENNTVHSGKAIISTTPPAGSTPDQIAEWGEQLIKDFRVNVTTGSAGHGSERGFGSLLQVLADNESSDSAFFRKDSLRGIIFVSDEDDQSVEIPATPDSDFSPWAYYACDQVSLEALNPTKLAKVSGLNGYCCSSPANNCRYGKEGTTCTQKTVNGYTYTPSICAREDKLIPVATVKEQLDGFFRKLDGVEDAAAPNYFVASIIAENETAIQSLQASRDADDALVNAIRTVAVDRGDRYAQLVELVQNNSLTMNIAEEDYTPVLDQIGKSIIENKSVFTLVRAPTGTEEMIVRVIRGATGAVEIIPAEKYVIEGKSLRIIDLDLVLGFSAADQISINYQPKTLY